MASPENRHCANCVGALSFLQPASTVSAAIAIRFCF